MFKPGIRKEKENQWKSLAKQVGFKSYPVMLYYDYTILLYYDYTIPLGTIIRNFLISFYMYADDSQLYKSVSLNVEDDQLSFVIQHQNDISDISDWMNNNLHLQLLLSLSEGATVAKW